MNNQEKDEKRLREQFPNLAFNIDLFVIKFRGLRLGWLGYAEPVNYLRDLQKLDDAGFIDNSVTDRLKLKWLDILEDENLRQLDVLSFAVRKWQTCAVGALANAIPRYPNGRPRDGRLEELGNLLIGDIQRREWKTARHRLNLIDDRAFQLLQASAGVGPQTSSCDTTETAAV